MDKDLQHSATELHIKNCLKGNWRDLHYVVSIKEYQIAILKNKLYQHRRQTVVLNEANVPCKNGGCILANYMWTFFHPSNHSKNVCVSSCLLTIRFANLKKAHAIVFSIEVAEVPFLLKSSKSHHFHLSWHLELETCNQYLLACWCLSNQQTSGTNDAPPPRLHGYHGGGQKCALAFGALRQEMIPLRDLLIHLH